MKVSVLINNFNYAPFLEECIDSVLSQTYKNFEIIIYDDGSTDNSVEIIKSYGDKVKFIANENYGKYPSFNQGNAIYQAFKISEGEIICLLDSDDCFEVTKIQKIVDVFQIDAFCDMVQHRMFEVNATGHKNGKIKKKGLLISDHPLELLYKTGRIDQFFMQTSALSFRRQFLETHLPFDETRFELVWPDVRLTRTVLFNGKFTTLIDPLTKYRIHTSNDSNKLKDKTYYLKFIDQQQEFINYLAKRFEKKSIYQKSGILNKIKSQFYILFSSMKWTSKKMYFSDLFSINNLKHNS
jgi:glycosyltransferase involved in cell wall biosynthesis